MLILLAPAKVPLLNQKWRSWQNRPDQARQFYFSQDWWTFYCKIKSFYFGGPIKMIKTKGLTHHMLDINIYLYNIHIYIYYINLYLYTFVILKFTFVDLLQNKRLEEADIFQRNPDLFNIVQSNAFWKHVIDMRPFLISFLIPKAAGYMQSNK